MNRLAVWMRTMVWMMVLPILAFGAPAASPAFADDPEPCTPRPPFVAPPFEQSPPGPSESRVHLVDNGDGTLTDLNTQLMWTRKDSYADLDRCLTWPEAQAYVHELRAGGHTDWRMPTISELTSIYDPTQANIKAWDKNPEYPLALDDKFADGAAYWYWSSECGTTELTECCGKTLYFVNGLVHMRRFEICNNGGVRAVRSVKKNVR